METELHRHETVPEGVRRIAHEQMCASLELLRARDDHLVHEVRKQCKQLRAVLRLVRFELGDEAYQRENARFRDLARPLTTVRDAEALLESLQKLESHFGRDAGARRFAGLHRALRRHLDEERSKVLGRGTALADARRAITAGLRDFPGWALEHRGWKALAPGLERTYRQARRAMAEAEHDPDDEPLHAWRKQTKYLRHQLELLEHAWPRVVGAMVEDLKELGDELGDDHDLAVLTGMVRGPMREAMQDDRRELLLALVAERRRELQKKAFKRGRRIFAERPRELMRLLHRQWAAWHDA